MFDGFAGIVEEVAEGDEVRWHVGLTKERIGKQDKGRGSKGWGSGYSNESHGPRWCMKAGPQPQPNPNPVGGLVKAAMVRA